MDEYNDKIIDGCAILAKDLNPDESPDKDGVLEKSSEQVSIRDEKGRYRKGFSGNPGGQKVNGDTFPNILSRLLEAKSLDDIDLAALTLKEKAALALVEKALDADLRALENMMDRMEGKPVATQRVDLSGNMSPFDRLMAQAADDK